jgi:hypothetical protein
VLFFPFSQPAVIARGRRRRPSLRTTVLLKQTQTTLLDVVINTPAAFDENYDFID